MVPDAYEGVLPSGRIGHIAPVSGGMFDHRGKYTPELFQPDPHRITDPVSGMAHYIMARGEPQNFYLTKSISSHYLLNMCPP